MQFEANFLHPVPDSNVHKATRSIGSMMPSPCTRPEVILTLRVGFEDKENRVQGQDSQGTTEAGVYRRGKKEVIQIGSSIGGQGGKKTWQA